MRAWILVLFVVLFQMTTIVNSLPMNSYSSNFSSIQNEIIARRHQLQTVTEQAEYTRIGIGILVKNMGNIDLKTGYTYLDFNLFFREDVAKTYSFEEYQRKKQEIFCDDYITLDDRKPSTSTIRSLSMANMASVHLRVDTIEDVATKRVDHMRVRGRFFSVTQLKNWPYEYQKVEVVLDDIMDYMDSNTNRTMFFCFLPSYSGISAEVRFPGEVDEIRLEPEITIYDVCAAPYLFPFNKVSGSCLEKFDCQLPCASDVSKYNFYPNNTHVSCRCKVGTKLTNRVRFSVQYLIDFRLVFTRLYLPALFIVLVNQATYFIPPKSWNSRFTVCGSTLLSTVTYHVNLINRTPENSIFTRADFFMLFVFIANILSWFFTVVLMILETGNFSKMAFVVFSWTRHMAIFVGLAVFSVPFIQHLTEDDAVIGVASVGTVIGLLAIGVLTKLLTQLFFAKVCTVQVREKAKDWLERMASVCRGEEVKKKKRKKTKIIKNVEMKEPFLVHTDSTEKAVL